MDLSALGAALEKQGVRLFIRRDGRLGAAPAERLTPDLATAIRTRRDDLLAALRTATPASKVPTSDDPDDVGALPLTIRVELSDAPLWQGARLNAFRRHFARRKTQLPNDRVAAAWRALVDTRRELCDWSPRSPRE